MENLSEKITYKLSNCCTWSETFEFNTSEMISKDVICYIENAFYDDDFSGTENLRFVVNRDMFKND